MAYLTPAPKLQFFDSNGNPLSSGLVYTYAAGTTTPLATYTDSSGATPNTNPIVLNSRGEANIWLGNSSYKFKLATSDNVEIWTVDNVEAYTTEVFSELAASSGASLIGFIQSDTGAVARTVENKFKDSISVKDFGAVGNGIADDTAAVQSALNVGGSIYFPKGKYRVTTTIDVPSNCVIFGDGPQKSIIAADFGVAGTYLLYPTGESNLVFKNLSFWGYKTENSGVIKAYGVYIYGCSNVLFENCEFSTFTTHSLAITKNFSTAWISGGNPNSQTSVDALVATSSKNITVRNCSFRYAGSNHIASFGVDNLWVEDNVFDANVTFYDVLVDDASQSTPLADYAINRNINVVGNVGTHGVSIVGASTANIARNDTTSISYNSYDFDQQILNFPTEPKPFLYLNYLKRGIVIEGNQCNSVVVKSGGYVNVINNNIQSSTTSTKLVETGNKTISWGGTAYFDSINETSVDTNFWRTSIINNTLVAAHASTTGIGSSTAADLYRLSRDNRFITRGSGAFTATESLPTPNNGAASQIVQVSNLKSKRNSRFVNEILDSGIATITVLSGAKSANTTISFNYNGSALPTAPIVLVSIQNMNNVIASAEEPATAGAYSITASGASIAVWLAGNAAADRAVSVAWVVIAQ